MVLLIVLELVRAAIQWWLGVVSWDVRLGVEYTVRERVVSKLNSLPLAYHQREAVGGTINRMNQGINGYVAAFSDLAFNLLPTTLYLVLSILAMYRLDWRLATAVIVFTPLPALIGARAAPEQIQRERRLVERWSSIYGRFNEVLAGMMTVKVFDMEEAEKRALPRRACARATRWFGAASGRTRETARSAASAATAARLAALALGGYFVFQGQIGLGTLVAFLGYIGGLFGPVQGVTNTYQTFRRRRYRWKASTASSTPRTRWATSRAPATSPRFEARSSSGRSASRYQAGLAGAARHRPDGAPGRDGGAGRAERQRQDDAGHPAAAAPSGARAAAS